MLHLLKRQLNFEGCLFLEVNVEALKAPAQPRGAAAFTTIMQDAAALLLGLLGHDRRQALI